MKNTYFDLIDQTFYFPQDGFDIDDGTLLFHGVPLDYLIKKYGTPLRLTYLPSIGTQIKKARNLFNRAIKSLNYKGQYHYCYCTKSAHFSFILDEVLEHKTQLETSSAFDIDIIRRLEELNKLDKSKIIINNGFKTKAYAQKIADLINDGYKNVIPVCDNTDEFDYYVDMVKEDCKIGLRVATEEEPSFEFYTSRLGIRNSEIIPFYKKRIARRKKITLKMLHFFVDTGIKDSPYYWDELRKVMKTYCELKKICKTLKAINIGGGLPIRNSLGFEYDYKSMIYELVSFIQQECKAAGVEEPDIFTEFGSFTVGESGAVLFSVLGQKQQNDSELWYIIDNSLMNTLPDSWGISQRFILLPINKWSNEYRRVNLGGITCDNSDYYNSEVHLNQVYLPAFSKEEKEPLYLGFFHIGAYQDALSGYGGIKHCLIPSPRHVIVDRDKKGNIIDWIYREEQGAEDMLRILGY